MRPPDRPAELASSLARYDALSQVCSKSIHSAACGFAALLVIVLKSDPLKDMITGVITTALGLGGA
ncbi:hypothetical protein GCM10023159_24760 [Brevibacterium yomogidense]